VRPSDESPLEVADFPTSDVPNSALFRLLELVREEEELRNRRAELLRRFWSTVRFTDADPLLSFGIPLPPAVAPQRPEQRAVFTIPLFRW